MIAAFPAASPGVARYLRADLPGLEAVARLIPLGPGGIASDDRSIDVAVRRGGPGLSQDLQFSRRWMETCSTRSTPNSNVIITEAAAQRTVRNLARCRTLGLLPEPLRPDGGCGDRLLAGSVTHGRRRNVDRALRHDHFDGCLPERRRHRSRQPRAGETTATTPMCFCRRTAASRWVRSKETIARVRVPSHREGADHPGARCGPAHAFGSPCSMRLRKPCAAAERERIPARCAHSRDRLPQLRESERGHRHDSGSRDRHAQGARRDTAPSDSPVISWKRG